jgi:mono/diheme cytochrome c family protein
MLGNLLGWLGFVVAAVFFGWLALRLWRAKHVLVKWVGVVLSGLLALALALVSVVMLIGLIKFYSPRNVAVPDLSVPMTPENIQRGEHIANSFCTSCHSVTGELPLTGGVDLGKDLALPLGTFVSSNLTPAGPLKDWSDGEIFAALRYGVNPDRRALVFMSTVRARNMSDADIQAVIAYLRSQPAVANQTQDPSDQPNLLAAFLSGAGMLPEGAPPFAGAITAPPKGATVEYGEYLLSYQDCRDCHGEDLKGGKEGQLAPIGWPLGLVKNWTLEQFISTMRTGVDPNGYRLSPNMPWRAIGRLDDIELEAMYLYLTSLP